MSDINLKLLHTFVLAAQHLSFRQVAELTNRSPSAVSMQIKELENQIGMRLFVRKAQRIELTPDGRTLFEKTRPALTEIREGLTYLADQASKRRGHVTIACAPTLAAQYLSPVLAAFGRRFPDSAVNVKEAPPSRALQLLRDQQAEFYLGPDVAGQTDFEFQRLFDDPMVACVPPHFDTGASHLSLSDLGDTPIILLDAQTSIRTLIDTLAATAGVSLNIRFELQNAYTGVALASAGLGIALMSRIATEMGQFDGFRTVPISDPGAGRAIGILTVRGYVQHSFADRFIKLIEQRFEGWPLGPNRDMIP